MGRSLKGRGSQKTCLDFKNLPSRTGDFLKDLEDKKGHPRIDAIIGPGIFLDHSEIDEGGSMVFYRLIMGVTEVYGDCETHKKRRMVMKTWKIFCLFAAIIGLPEFAQAAEDPNEAEPSVTLEEVVVTGTRTEQRVERIPANITVIDEAKIKNSNAKSIPDLLRSEEGIVVRDLLGTGKTAQVDLRGFGETAPFNTLVLVDGRRVNEIDLSGVDWTQISLDQVERIEIVRGTGTVLYGDNAVGGVINIISKTPSEGLTFTAGSTLGSYSRNQKKVSLRAGKDNVAASISASYDSTDGYRENNNFRAKDIGGKIVYDALEHLSLNLSGTYHSDEYGLPGDLTEADLEIDRRGTNEPLNEAQTRDKYLQLGTDVDLGACGAVEADISYRGRDIGQKFVNSSYISYAETKTWGFTPRYIWDGEIFERGNTLIAGVDLYWSEQDVQSFFGAPPAPSGLASVEKDSYGLYFNNDYSILKDLILSIGARHEHVKYDLKKEDLTGFFGPLSDSVTEREKAYSGGLSYLYKDKSSLFLRANRSLRFPLTDELIEFDQLTGQPRVNSDLKPQEGKHYEVGIRHFFTPDFMASLTLFRAKIKDEIFLNPTPAPYFGTNSNHPKTLHQGVEVGARADLFRNLTLSGSYTYEKATFKTDPFEGNDIPAVPRHKANFGLRIHDVVPGLVFSADYNYVGSSFLISDQANQLKKLDDYYTLNTRLSYEWKSLRAFVGVSNLTDEKYAEYGVAGAGGTTRNFYPAPERNWEAGIEITF